MRSAAELEEGSGGTQPGVRGHPRVLRVVVVYQPVQNYCGILTISVAPPEITGVPGTEGHQVSRTQDFSGL